MNFKNKLFIIFIALFIFILFFSINNSFAISSYEEISIHSYDENLLNALDEVEYYGNPDYYYFIYTNGNQKTLLQFIKKSECTNFKSYMTFNYNSLKNLVNFYYSSDTEYTLIEYSYDGNSFNYEFTGTRSSSMSYLYGYSVSDDVYFNFISNCNVYLDDFETVFFQPVTGVVIPALETAQEVPTAMVQTLKIIIPVGLVLFGIGLSVYLIRRILS